MKHETRSGGTGLGMEQLQLRLQTAITDQAASTDVDDFAVPSERLSAAERVRIYRRMYIARLVETLADDYSTVRMHLGAEAFRELVIAYAAAHPSRSYTLARFGDRLPRYLAENASGYPRGALLVDLARFEAALNRAFDAEPARALDVETIRRIPLERWSSTRLVPAPALELLELEHEVGSHLQAAQDEEESLPAPRRERTRLAIYRKDWTARWTELTEPAFTVLSALCEGDDLAEALAAGVKFVPATEREETVFAWFHEWFGEGFFTAVESLEEETQGRM
jgi:hypothetical protein